MVLVSATPWEYDIVRSCQDEKTLETTQDDFDFKENQEVEFKNYTTSDKAYQKAQEFFEFDPTQWGVWSASEDMRIVPQVIRPTGLLDPIIELRSMRYMVDDVMKNLREVIDAWDKMLITTLTKRSSEELTDYLLENWIKVKYLHSEIETLERLETLKDLRTGKIDVIVWVNLLREWLDLPEVTKICILDADKQWFLRSSSALIQIIWRAARNQNGKVYMYSETIENEKKLSEILQNNKKDFMLDEYGQKIDLYVLDKGKMITKEWHFVSSAMKVAINLTNYRRKIQKLYNDQNGITPTTIISGIKDIWIESKKKDYSLVSEKDLEKEVKRLQFEMDVAAANMEYEKAAEIRDMILDMKKAKKK